MKRQSRWIQLVAFLTVFVVTASVAQTASVTVDQPYAGDRNVTGQAASASTPVTVYEVLGTARNFLGKSTSLDQRGFYAISVNPALIAGHQIVVVDAQGHSSSVITVTVKKDPTGPRN